MKTLHYYSLQRVYFVFHFLLSVYLVIKKKERFLIFKPLSPKKLHDTIIYLGASFIKLAQVLATRADFFSSEYLDELKNLHDKLPKMSDTDFQEIYKQSFSQNPFDSFEIEPIGSASIGQVHVAYLDGQKLAVKLRRKGIAKQVNADIRIIKFFNSIFAPLFSFYTKNSIDAVISEFSIMIAQEVSLTQELANLEKFSLTYSDSGIRFPKPLPQFCSDDALVMSFEEGFRFDDKENILKYNINFKKIIEMLVNFYTTQMLIKGYFHADPHPGNILITKEGDIVMLDFGMVKTVPNDTRIAIIELLKAANEKNYELYISASKRLGTIAYEAPTSELAGFTEKMFDIFSNDNLTSESMQQLAFEVLETTRNFPFKLPSDAIYILRVSAIIEGLGTTYIENFNGVKDILPVLTKNLPKALGASDSILESIVDEIQDIPFILRDIKTVVKKASQGELNVMLSQGQLEWMVKELKSYTKSTIISFGLLVLSFFILLYDKDLKILAATFAFIGFLRLVYK
ncbi:MAG: AarF/ABC1/UbiB kinase family protein [Sulfurospirillum sp.]|nr:AarF/ABC1/UbiB kinase family protein [Sulfurospirillum sp.]